MNKINKEHLGRDLNVVYCDNWLNNNLPDKCAKLLICDPPYFEVKGEFDFIWKTFADYLADVEKWAIECKRVLADNGTLLWYGSSKNIAYAQIILDKYFNLESSITIHIFDRQTNKIKPEDARAFINTKEMCLMYSTGWDDNGTNKMVNKAVKPIRDYLRNGILKSKGKISLKDINLIFGSATNGGGLASGILSLEKEENIMITRENYIKLQEWCPLELRKEYEELRKEYEELRKEYEELRKEYEELRRPFTPTEKYKMDVLRVSQEGHITGKYDHDTVKPEKLTRILINACSRPNDLIVVPFAGSGTECSMAAKEGRPFIGFDIEQKHVNTSNKRCKQILDSPTLF